jgi:hypothetical protein
MTSLPVTRNAARSINVAVLRRGNTSDADGLRDAMADPDLIAILIFCSVGLLITFNAIIGFASFASSVDQLAQFLG